MAQSPKNPRREVPPVDPPAAGPESPADILARSGYFDEAGNLRLEFVSRASMAPIAQAMSSAQPPLTAHQIRRFFQHCRAIEARLKSGRSWEQERPAVETLDRAVADAIGKSPPKIPEAFHAFIMANVAAVRGEKDFLEGFLPHFEALVGFGSGLFRERERN